MARHNSRSYAKGRIGTYGLIFYYYDANAEHIEDFTFVVWCGFELSLRLQVSLDKGDRKDRDLHEDLWFELSDESLCNWMMFVRPAQNHLEQNLVAYQYGHHVYYTTIKNVEPKQELKVRSCLSGGSARNCD